MEETLNQILNELKELKAGQESMKNDINGLKSGQERMEQRLGNVEQRLCGVEQRLDSMEHTLNATFVQTTRLTEFRTEANSKLDNITSKIGVIEAITKENLYDITQLKLAK